MKALISILWVFVASGLSAQSMRDTIYLASRSYGDSVVLRWAPGSPHLWKVGNRIGYRIERREAGSDNYVLLNKQPLKPYSLSEWKRRCDTTSVHVTTAAQVLLGSVMMEPKNAGSFGQKLLTSEEERNRLALALYSAEFSTSAANGLALRWVDRTVSAAGIYVYRVSLWSLPRNTNVLEGLVRQVAGAVYRPEPVTGVAATGKDGVIEVSWNKKENDRHFTGYYIERSDDGKRFTRLRDIPYKTTGSDELDPAHIYKDEITVYGKDYYYRVIGITSFADPGEYSNVVKAHTADLNGPAPPQFLRAESLTEQSVKLSWQDNPVAPDHGGYFVGRSTSIHGPFERLNKTPINTTVREYVDRQPILHKPNFYTIVAVDRAGNENSSVVAMAVLPDGTPPATPEGLTGHVDSLGVVSLGWKLGTEPDLMGYRVFRADHPKGEYVQITRAPIPGNFYMDTIPLNTLTEHVYYKVAAFDFNYNPSSYTGSLELRRPDLIPPVRPLIKRYSVVEDTVTIEFISSSSKDVVRQVLYRKSASSEWEELAVLKASSGVFRDGTGKSGVTYYYALEAFDKSGLASGKSAAVVIAKAGGAVPTVTEVRGEFDKTSKTFTLNWKYNHQGNFKFVIYRAPADEPLRVYASVAEATAFIDRSFFRNESGYTYAVKVLSAEGGESALSPTVKASFEP